MLKIASQAFKDFVKPDFDFPLLYCNKLTLATPTVSLLMPLVCHDSQAGLLILL